MILISCRGALLTTGILAGGLVAGVGASAQAPDFRTNPTNRIGILVMAHGGTTEWNEAVARAVRPINDRVPTVVAYGMADPRTLGAALDTLAATGVSRVAVVRLFMSGRSFSRQTRYLLGLSEDRPEWFVTDEARPIDSVAPIDHGLEVATHISGLMNSEAAATIMLDRVQVASVHPNRESVLLIAHGMEGEQENDEVLAAMAVIADRIRSTGFARVETATLREDWPEEREAAEGIIRDFVYQESALGRLVIVAPFRLSGFGPYATVLDGLAYSPTPGLLPHDAITEWISEVATEIACSEGWSGEIVAWQAWTNRVLPLGCSGAQPDDGARAR